MFQSIRGFTPSICAALAIALAATPSRPQADETSEVLNGVTIEDARAAPAESGGATRLRFRIENASGRTVALDAIRSPDAEEGVLVVVGDNDAQPAAAGLLLLDQETLDLGTSHLVAELRGLGRPLRDGDFIEFEAVFRAGTAPARAHVHAESKSWTGARQRAISAKLMPATVSGTERKTTPPRPCPEGPS